MLENLEPKKVFEFFEELTKIPRPSYKEKKVSDFLVKFAEDRGLEHYQDELGNVIIIKEAAKGYENEIPVILQGHMDMVCEKEPGLDKNMDEEGVDVTYDDKFVFAKGTSLGGDDGAGVAYCLALLDDKELKAPRIEVVVTVAEEIGMDGATAVDLSMLKGKRLINLDSEEEGIFCVGCAGGSSVEISYEGKKEKKSGEILEFSYDGFTGGHSGSEITRGGANAVVAIARVIADVAKNKDICIESLTCNGKDNAIARRASARLLVKPEEKDEIVTALLDEAEKINDEFAVSDPDCEASVLMDGEKECEVFSAEESLKIVTLILAEPNGIISMSHDVEGMPETSLNVGVLSTEGNKVSLVYAVRSAVETARYALENRLDLIAKAFGAKCVVSSPYPAWEYKKDSTLRDKMVEIYEEMFGEKPEVVTIHAGVECGILVQKIEGLDSISIGPNIYDVHTTEEKLDIESTRRTFEYVKKVLETK
ncbi:MAG: aminoacyl-histidine dipeptidase [Lachnospiraceae bacterium]|nr:aminoacyl-histidine dipeptidase [Lachnospiraceae bacterium]